MALLQAPALEELEAACLELEITPDPPALERALLERKIWLGRELASQLQVLCHQLAQPVQQLWPAGVGQRQLLGLAWSWLVAGGLKPAELSLIQHVEGSSMTLARAALAALQPWDCPERSDAMEVFQSRWLERPVILDNWFALQASAPFGDAIARAEALLSHPRFDPQAPNSLRAVLGGFARCAQSFHKPDGSGYRWLADQLVALDVQNPIAASRFLKLFMGWRNYGPQRKDQMQTTLYWLLDRLHSANSQEITRQCLGL